MSREHEQLRSMIEQHEESLLKLKMMLDRIESPAEVVNPLFPRSVVAGNPSSDRLASELPPPPPGPAPGAVPKKSQTLHAIEHWDQIIFRPSLASAMLYVIMPVIEQMIDTTSKLIAGDSNWSTFAELVSDLDTWGKLTIAQRVAFEDLFMWVNQQLAVEHSVIPPHILSNMAAVSAAYDATDPR